jgi:ubiquinone/menaquinone biosynthesis C-methylase UbiE
MTEKIRETHESFDGLLGGVGYDAIARLTGYGPSYYHRAARALPVWPGMTLLDLGCGTASLSLAVAERLRGRGRIIGIDLSVRQLDRARTKIHRSPVEIELRQGSVRELDLEDESVDGIFASQVLHGLPDDVREQALAEASRVLRPGGFFGLVEWGRPRIGFAALVWTATLLGSRDTPNWRGTYADLFRTVGLELSTDVHLDSLNRCQVFVKSGPVG